MVDFRDLKTQEQIVGVRSYLTLFVYKGNSAFSTVSSSSNLLSMWKSQSLPTISIGIQLQNVDYLTKFLQFHNIPQHVFTLHTVVPSFQTCRGENIFETYDALFMDTYNFTRYVRGYREPTVRMSSVNGLINSFDFIPYPLFPSTVYISTDMSDSNASANIYQFTDITLPIRILLTLNLSDFSPDIPISRRKTYKLFRT